MDSSEEWDLYKGSRPLQKKFSVENFAAKKKEFLDDLVTTVEMEEILPELILNWDQTGIQLVPSSSWTMSKEVSREFKWWAKMTNVKLQLYFVVVSREISPCASNLQGKNYKMSSTF